MYTFLIVILIIDAVILGAAVLLQAGKGGGLAQSFGGASSSADSVLGTRQAGNLLTKTSWWAGGIFIGLAFVLQIMSARSRVPTSILDRALAPSTQQAPTAAPASEPAVQSAVPLQDAQTTPTAPTTPPPQP